MTTDRTAVPIFYRTDKYTAVDQGRQRAFSAGQKVERRGGKGTEKTKDKWVNWVQLQDNATQETFYVVNTHLLVGAYNKGVNGKNKKRIALYKQQLNTVTALTDQFQSSGSSVYVTCDCNVNYDADADPVAAMGDSGLIANWRDLDGSPTLGKKQRLDYVWSNRTPSGQTIGEKSGSDHSAVTVTYPPSTGPSGTMTPVNGSTRQEIYSMRTVTDPTSSRTFLVPIPTGRAGKVLNAALDQVGDQWTVRRRRSVRLGLLRAHRRRLGSRRRHAAAPVRGSAAEREERPPGRRPARRHLLARGLHGDLPRQGRQGAPGGRGPRVRGRRRHPRGRQPRHQGRAAPEQVICGPLGAVEPGGATPSR